MPRSRRSKMPSSPSCASARRRLADQRVTSDERNEKNRMKRLIALTLKEFRQLRRDTLTLRMIVLVPLMQMFIFGYAINFDVKHLTTVVLDESRSYDSRELVAKMAASEYFSIVGSVTSFAQVRQAHDSAQAVVAVVIAAD